MSLLIVSKEHIAAHDIAKQEEFFTAQLKEKGKPQAACPKIVVGKLAKWFTEVTLHGQESVLEPSATVEKLRTDVGKVPGVGVKLYRLVRLALGEGIEKTTDNVAEQVMKMARAQPRLPRHSVAAR